MNVPLLVVDKRRNFVKIAIICREYIVGLTIEAVRKDLPKESLDDQKRSCEMVALILYLLGIAVHPSDCNTKDGAESHYQAK